MMNNREIARRRLAQQYLLQPAPLRAAELVAIFGAMQAQDYYGAKWAIGQRLTHATDAALDAAFDAGEILRTHVLRPTWHFVTPDDIRWLLDLTAPRVHVASASMYRRLELDDALFRRCEKIFVRTLRDGKCCTREELGAALERANIPAVGQRLAYLVMHAELQGVICSGARRGKQFTYALLDERAPNAKILKRDEALHELTRRYFFTRGPTTTRDFAWWSGLTLREAQQGIASCDSELTMELFEEQTYWSAPQKVLPKMKSPRAHLLPNYDEYFIGLRNRSAMLDPHRTTPSDARDTVLSNHLVFIDGAIVGGWSRTVFRDRVALDLRLLRAQTNTHRRAIQQAADRYAEFLELPLRLREQEL